MDLSVELCRFCMTKVNLSTIFKSYEGLTMKFKAIQCNLFNNSDDSLPQYICKVCEYKVHFFYEFKVQCEITNQKLKELFNSKEFKTEVEVKIESEDVKNNIEDNVNIKCELDDDNYNSLSSHDDTTLVDIADIDKPKLKKYKANKKRLKIKRKNTLCSNVITDKIDINIKSSNIKTEEKPSINLKPFQCELCGQTFRLKCVLKKHLTTHNSEKMYGCSLCPKRYTREEHRVAHMRTHVGEKPFICEICARPFTKNQDLVRHKRIHSDEKKFACSRCDRKFKRSGDVHAHMRTHTGVKPFMCVICSKLYASRGGLKKHLFKGQCNKYPDKCVEKVESINKCNLDNKTIIN